MYTDWLLKMKENEAQTTLEERVVELLAEHKMTVTTAESCTGGLIAATLVNVPGASDVLNEGYITYSNEAKIRLVNVSPETLERSVPRQQKKWRMEQQRRQKQRLL